MPTSFIEMTDFESSRILNSGFLLIRTPPWQAAGDGLSGSICDATAVAWLELLAVAFGLACLWLFGAVGEIAFSLTLSQFFFSLS